MNRRNGHTNVREKQTQTTVSRALVSCVAAGLSCRHRKPSSHHQSKQRASLLLTQRKN